LKNMTGKQALKKRKSSLTYGHASRYVEVFSVEHDKGRRSY
jgi:hypothetical protein